MTEPRAAEAFPAGEHLREELDARGWTQADFAEILGRPAQLVSEIITGKKEITRETAAQIGAALGTSAELWRNLQDSYHLWRLSQDAAFQGRLDSVRGRALTRGARATMPKAGDLPTNTIVGAQYGAFIRADLDDRYPWRGTTTPPWKTDAEMDAYLADSAQVLRVGDGSCRVDI